MLPGNSEIQLEEWALRVLPRWAGLQLNLSKKMKLSLTSSFQEMPLTGRAEWGEWTSAWVAAAQTSVLWRPWKLRYNTPKMKGGSSSINIVFYCPCSCLAALVTQELIRCNTGACTAAWEMPGWLKIKTKQPQHPRPCLSKLMSALDEMLPGSAAPFLCAKLPLIKAQPLGKQEPGLQ